MWCFIKHCWMSMIFQCISRWICMILTKKTVVRLRYELEEKQTHESIHFRFRFSCSAHSSFCSRYFLLFLSILNLHNLILYDQSYDWNDQKPTASTNNVQWSWNMEMMNKWTDIRVNVGGEWSPSNVVEMPCLSDTMSSCHIWSKLRTIRVLILIFKFLSCSPWRENVEYTPREVIVAAYKQTPTQWSPFVSQVRDNRRMNKHIREYFYIKKLPFHSNVEFCLSLC
jgi:hypothetical protein